MSEPIRVLQVVGRMDRGGIETMIMNLYRNIDRDKVQFDFLAHFGREAAYNDEIRALGGRIYEMPALRDEKRVFFWRFFSYIGALKKFFREHKEYKVIHLELMDWLNRYTFPEEEKYEDLAYAEKAYGMFVGGLRSGATTRACIFATRHREATVLLMDLMEKSGLISYVGKVNMDREATPDLEEESALRSAFDTFGWINDIRDRFKRTHPILTPRFIPSCTDQLMEELREIQMAYGIPVPSHLSESPGEIDFVHYLRPQNAFYGEAYNDYDLFGYNDDIDTHVKTVMAHCVWSTAEEVKLMRKNGVYIAHCPASNMNLSSGIAPIRRYMDLGMRVGLGSDVAGGHSDSIFRAVTDAIQVSKMYWRYVDPNAKAVTFPEAFCLATKGGGEFFGKVGSFEDGYEFDAVVLDDSVLTHPQELSLTERLERAVYLQLDMRQGVCGKYIGGEKLF